MKPEDSILYWTQVKTFRKRVWQLFAPYAILYVFLFSFVFLNGNSYKPIALLWIMFISLIALGIFIGCYTWALNKITKISEIEGGLEIEMVTKDKMRRWLVSGKDLTLSSKRIARRPSMLKLSLFDLDKKIVDLYSSGSFKDLGEMEKLKYELTKYLGAAHVKTEV